MDFSVPVTRLVAIDYHVISWLPHKWFLPHVLSTGPWLFVRIVKKERHLITLSAGLTSLSYSPQLAWAEGVMLLVNIPLPYNSWLPIDVWLHPRHLAVDDLVHHFLCVTQTPRRRLDLHLTLQTSAFVLLELYMWKDRVIIFQSYPRLQNRTVLWNWNRKMVV